MSLSAENPSLHPCMNSFLSRLFPAARTHLQLPREAENYSSRREWAQTDGAGRLLHRFSSSVITECEGGAAQNQSSLLLSSSGLVEPSLIIHTGNKRSMKVCSDTEERSLLVCGRRDSTSSTASNCRILQINLDAERGRNKRRCFMAPHVLWAGKSRRGEIGKRSKSCLSAESIPRVCCSCQSAHVPPMHIHSTKNKLQVPLGFVVHHWKLSLLLFSQICSFASDAAFGTPVSIEVLVQIPSGTFFFENCITAGFLYDFQPKSKTL